MLDASNPSCRSDDQARRLTAVASSQAASAALVAGWLLLILVAPLAALSASEMPHGRVTMVLGDALLGVAAEDAEHSRRVADLVLHTHYGEDGWAPVIGMAPDFNRAHHRGRVQRMRQVDDALHLEVAIRIAGDPWVPGGAAAYHIVVPLDDAKQWSDQPVTGSYTGRFDVHGVNGTVLLTLQAQESLAADAILADSHPRLWFAAQDLRDLRRRRQQSPVLAAAYESMADADSILSLGMMFHLTGDTAYAQRARARIQGRMEERGDGIGNRGLEWGHRLRDVAYAYDLFGATWDDDFVQALRGYLDWIGQRLLHRPNTVSRTLNWSPTSEYQATLRGAAALAALVLQGTQGPETQPPRPLGEQPRRIVSDPELSAFFIDHDGQRLRDNRLPRQWWLAGPLPDPQESEDDFLAHLGGSSAFHRVFSGEESIQYEGGQARFEPLDEAYFWDYHGRRNIELTDLFARYYQRKEDGYYHTAYFYTVLDVAQDQLMRYADHPGGPRLQAWINGRRLHAGDYLSLAPGRHVLLVRAFIGSTSSWGKMWMSPRFRLVSEDQMREDIRRRQVDYELRFADFEEDKAYFSRHQGSNPAWRHMAAISHIHMDDYYRHAIGEGGWSLGGDEGLATVLEYHTAFARMHGHGVNTVDDIEVLIVRHIYQMVFADDKQYFASIDASGPIEAKHIARAWPRIPEAYQPAVLWLWDRLLLGSGENIRFADGDEAFFTYLHYPVGMQSRHPHEVLARHWYAPGMGGVVFRNSFYGPEDDIIIQALARQQGEGYRLRPNAGAVSVWGFGHEWAARPAQNPPQREHESVVHLPGLQHNRFMRGEVLEIRHDSYGGFMHIDLSLVYAGTRTRADRHGRERPHSLVDNMQRLRREHIDDIGMRGGRSIAVDFSGRSGAPAVWVVIDRIEGGRNQAKRWHWNLPQAVTDTDCTQLQLNESSFRLQQGDAIMQASLLYPSRLRLEPVFNTRQDIPGQANRVMVHGIQARGRRGDEGSFVAVFTLGRDEPPAVQVLQREDGVLRLQVGNQEVVVRDMDVQFLDQIEDNES